jgi:tetratricopeptide (TPR) repeat protein
MWKRPPGFVRSPAPGEISRGVFRPARRRIRGLGTWIVLSAVLLLTGWHARQSRALAEAEAAYSGRPNGGLVASCWEKARAAWSGKSSRVAAETLAQPDLKLALQRSLDHLSCSPHDPRAARIAALCLSKLDYAAGAEPYYRIARDAGSLGPDDLFVRGLGLARGNSRDQAVEAFQEVLRLRPDDAAALQRLAAVYYSQSRYKEVLAAAQRLARAPDGGVAGYALIGIVFHDEHKVDEAIAAYEKVLQLDPDLSRLSYPADLFYTDLSEDLLEAGRPAEARRYLSRALAMKDDAVLMDLLGTAYRLDGQPENAALCWKKAAEWDPRFYRAWLNLGMLALESDRLAEATEALGKAHELAPDMLAPAYQLSLVHKRAGRAIDAERYRGKADVIRGTQRSMSRNSAEAQAVTP